jgi:hypothetical protein
MAEPTGPDPQSRTESDSTGLPVLSTWPAVYLFVLGAFVGWIILLSLLSRAFS